MWYHSWGQVSRTWWAHPLGPRFPDIYFATQSRCSLIEARHRWQQVQVHRKVLMKGWLIRIRGVVGMGLSWAVGWGLTGLLIGVTSILLLGLPKLSQP